LESNRQCRRRQPARHGHGKIVDEIVDKIVGKIAGSNFAETVW
jgi:hypothetical protein